MTGRRLHVIVEADGGSRGNPGLAGYGALVRAAESGEVLLERAEAIGIATNNVAEYSGLVAGLQAAIDLGATDVHVRMDSKLVVEQMCGRWQIKNAGLRPLAAEAAALVRAFHAVTYEWIPRAQNVDADRLANEAMDAASGKGTRTTAERPATLDVVPPRASLPPASTPVAGPAPTAAGWAPQVGAPLRLILVRHGEATLTKQGRYAGHTDSALTAYGRRQAQATAARIAALAPDVTAIYTSPLSRCADTAATIAAVTGGQVHQDKDLIECHFGEWEALTFGEVRERWPAEHATWLSSTALAPPGGESFDAVSIRVRRAVSAIRARYSSGTVVLVSHVSPIKLLLRDALVAGDEILHRLYLDPVGISIVDSWPDGGVAVRSINDTAHVPADVD